MQKEYLVVINGKPTGPYSLNELKELNIHPNSFVRKPGMDDFKEAHAIEELRELFGFSAQKTIPQYFASFDQRLLATVIDHFIIFGIYILLVLIVFSIVEDSSQRMMIFFSFLPSIFLVKLIYGIFAEASSKQATIGKRFLAIKVSTMEGSRITIGQSAFRNIAKIFSVIPCFFGFFYSFLNKKNQCWHDIASNCLVIKDRLI